MIFQTFVRKHQKLFLFLILGAVGVPMAFFVTGSSQIFPDSGTAGTEIGKVGDIPVTAQELAGAIERAVSQRQQSDPEFEPRSLAADGTLSEIREQLIQQKLIEREIEEQDLLFTRDYLADQLKQLPDFQTADGRLDATLWNQWVQDETVNWNALYEGQADMSARTVFSQRLMAGARVLESDLKKQFEEQQTEVTVKYKAIELPVEVTDEEVQAYYDANAATRFMTPTKHVFQYVRFPLTPPQPAVAAEVVEKARAGESFSVLAAEHSEGMEKDSGGDLGWITITDDLDAPRDVLKDMAVGDVSDVIFWGRGYYIYYVEEERTNDAGQREVKARQVAFFPELSEEERAQLDAKAADFRAAVEQGEDFETFAATNGLTVVEAGPIDRTTEELEGIPTGDLFSLRGAFIGAEAGTLSDVVEGLDNLYVAEVTEVVPPVARPFEEVAEQVRDAVIAERKRAPEYQDQVTAVAEEIAAQASSLDEIATAFPNLVATEINEMGPFTAQTFDFSAGLMLNPTAIMDAVADKEPGALVGPLQDFLGGTFFMELVAISPPSDEVWETEWPEARQRLHDQNLGMAQAQYADDYLKSLEEDAYSGTINIDLSDSAMLEVLYALYPASDENPLAESPDGALPAGSVESVIPDWVTDAPAEGPEEGDATDAPADEAAPAADDEAAPAAATTDEDAAPSEASPEPSAEDAPANP